MVITEKIKPGTYNPWFIASVFQKRSHNNGQSSIGNIFTTGIKLKKV